MIKTTIVVTTYNGERFINEQLDSLKNQLLPADEVLIFDDRSTDETGNIISAYIKKYALFNWKLIINDKQLGWKKNFMLGFRQAKGEIIFPCDQDDIWHKDKLLNMADILNDNSNINVLASNYKPFFQDDAEVFSRDYQDDGKIDMIPVNSHNLYNQRPGCAMAFRKEFFEEYYKLWNENLAHDEFLWKCALLSNSLAIYNKYTIDYRRHMGNVTKITRKKKKKISRRVHSLSNRVSENRACRLFFEKSSEERIFKYTSLIHSQYTFYLYREEFFKHRSIVNYVKLIPFIKFYKTRNNCIGDFMYLIYPKYFD